MYSSPISEVVENPDLVDIIFGFCRDHGTKELLCASLTCKTFLEPGLNVLWRNVHNFLQVCRLLPMFDKETRVFEDIVRDENLERVVYYVHRIHYLEFHIETTIHKVEQDLDSGGRYSAAECRHNVDILFSVFTKLSNAAAFRSLRNLNIIDDPSMPYRHQLLLFQISAPNLEVLEISTGSIPQTSVANFLHTISSRLPKLKSLYLELSRAYISWTVINVLPCFHMIQKLCIYEMMSCDDVLGFVEHCALSLVALRSLLLSLDSEEPEAVGPSGACDSTRITFSLLTELDLAGYPREMKDILNVLFVPELVTLDLFIRCRYRTSIPTLNPFVDGFLKSNGHLKDQLQKLTITTFSSQEFSLGGYLDPFRSFTKLDFIYVRTESNDHFFSTPSLVSVLEDTNWSNITHLDFHFGVSIDALPAIATACPKLQNLSISIPNLDQAGCIELVTTSSTQVPHGLETLVLRRSPNCTASTASFLRQIFPMLKEMPRSYSEAA